MPGDEDQPEPAVSSWGRSRCGALCGANEEGTSLTRIVGVNDLATIVRAIGLTPLLDELIARLRQALADYDPESVQTHDRTGFSYLDPDPGLIEWMPAMDRSGRTASVKTVAYHPNNPRNQGLPTVLATTSLYDTVDGRLVSLSEATLLTALRTGAASAIATDVLAIPGASDLGLIGCGAQAVSQVHAISRVRPITKVVGYDRDPSVAATFVARMSKLGLAIDIELVGEGGLGQLVAECDVLCTCTTVEPGAGPVLPESEHRPWLHINAVGADFPGKTEIPPSYLQNGLVCPDVATQCLAEGEAQQLDPTELGPDLAMLTRSANEYDRHQRLLTVFDSTGWALEDLVAAEVIRRHAIRLDVGIEVDLQPTANDPHDPYASLGSATEAHKMTPSAGRP